MMDWGMRDQTDRSQAKPDDRHAEHTRAQGDYAYTAFISYSHAADGDFAPRLQAGLQRFAKPWYRLHAMRVFRDETSLSNNPELWKSIERALDRSEYLLVLGSPRSAESEWVRKEISYWLKTRSKEKLLIVVTDGDLHWNDEQRRFDWTRTSALPKGIDYGFEDVPRYTDFRQLRAMQPAELSLRNPTFLQAIADVASTLLGKDKDVLLGEDVRQHRRTKRITWTAVLVLFLLTVASIVAATFAVRNQREADRRRRLAQSRVLAAQSLDHVQGERLDLAALLALEAHDPPYTHEARTALFNTFSAAASLSTTLHPGEGGVDEVVFSPGGSRLATAGGGSIRLWSATTFEPLAGPLDDHADAIFALAFSPDGSVLVSGSRSDANLLLWDITGEEPTATPLRAHRSGVAVSGLSFSPDGRWLASAGGDNVIVLWDVLERAPVGEPFTGHSGFIQSVAFSPDGRWLASGSQDHTARVWDVQSREPRLILERHRGQVQDVAFHPDGGLLATASAGQVTLWDPITGDVRGHPLEHDTRVDVIAFSPDGTLLASAGSGSDEVVIWDVVRQQVDRRLTAHTGWIGGLAFSPDGRTLATASQDGTVILWTLDAPPPLGRRLSRTIDRVESLAISDDGATLATGTCGVVRGGVCRQGEIWLWSMTDGALLAGPLTGHEGAVHSLVFTDGGTHLKSSGCSTFEGSRCAAVEVRTWQTDPARPIGEPIHAVADGVAMALAPDGALLAVTDGAEILMFDAVTGRRMDRLLTGIERVLDMTFSPDATVLAASTLNDRTMLWNAASGMPLNEPLRGRRLAFGPGGRSIVTVLNEELTAPSSLVFWDAVTGQPTRETRTAYYETVLTVAMSPDGALVALGGYDGAGVLWDGASNQLLGILRGHDDAVLQIAFAPDGQTLVTADGSGVIMLWDLGFETWQRRACEIANRNLSYAEWLQHRGDEPYRRTCADRPAHPSLVIAAASAARSGDVERGARLFQRAVELDSQRAGTLDPRAESRRLAAEGLVERGRDVAKTGNVERAAALFERARDLDRELDLDPLAEAARAAAPAILATGQRYAERGMVARARAAYERAAALDSTLEITANDWGILCWSAIVNAQTADGVQACDLAVERSESSENHRDTRGLIRALTGDLAGAITDLEAYLDWWQRRRPQRGSHGNQFRSVADLEKLSGWIEALRAGANPITPEEISALRRR